MGTWTLKHEGLSFFHLFHWHRPVRSQATFVPSRPAPAAVAAPPVSREVSERRAAAMRGFFPKLASWIEQKSYEAEMREVDRYLSQSTSIFDLENRIRRIERGGCVPRLY